MSNVIIFPSEQKRNRNSMWGKYRFIKQLIKGTLKAQTAGRKAGTSPCPQADR